MCIVQAGNPGGVTTFRSATTPAIVADTALPGSAITALKCHLQTCALSFTASDPNGVALNVQPSAAYTVTAKCTIKRKGRRRARKVVCHKTKTLKMSLKTLGPGSFGATVSRLPYGEKITFTVVASNTVGLEQAPPASAHTTLHKPKPKKKAKKKKH